MNVEELKQRAKAVWATGDYSPTSRLLAPASQALVDALGIGPGHRVLDVAAGHGNCAIAAARRGAAVLASDFSPEMIETGRARANAEGLNIEWAEADAADLPFDDDAFDRVTSVFGAIFAPDQEKTAAEAVRVTRRGGMIGFTTWTPDGYVARLLGIARCYGPPAPADVPDPLQWGRPAHVHALFEPLGCSVAIRTKTLTFRFPSWQAWSDASEAHGMAVVAKKTMPPERYAQMSREMQQLADERNYGEGGAVVYDAEYLELLVTKR